MPGKSLSNNIETKIQLCLPIYQPRVSQMIICEAAYHYIRSSYDETFVPKKTVCGIEKQLPKNPPHFIVDLFQLLKVKDKNPLGKEDECVRGCLEFLTPCKNIKPREFRIIGFS